MAQPAPACRIGVAYTLACDHALRADSSSCRGRALVRTSERRSGLSTSTSPAFCQFSAFPRPVGRRLRVLAGSVPRSSQARARSRVFSSRLGEIRIRFRRVLHVQCSLIVRLRSASIDRTLIRVRHEHQAPCDADTGSVDGTCPALSSSAKSPTRSSAAGARVDAALSNNPTTSRSERFPTALC